jgi:hypothetical protein
VVAASELQADARDHHNVPVPPPRPHGRRPLQRSDLPAEFTPETVRRLGVGTLRELADPSNTLLDPQERQAFDAALRAVMQDTTDRLDDSLRRARRGGPGALDPQLRHSYDRTQRRLALQARRVRQHFPELAPEWDGEPVAPPEELAAPDEDTTDVGDDVSLATLESEIEQTSDTLDILERIATIQEQQLAHQRTQLRRDTRGVFFALLVSVAVIVSGVAPLVEASPRDRRLIVLWTLVVCAVSSVVYASVRAVQSRRDGPGSVS